MSEVKQAPTLPKGYFFRVSKGYNTYVVELHKKIIGRVITQQFDYWSTDHADEVYYLMEKLKGQLERHNEVKKAGEKYYGDYPPKKNVGGQG